MNLENHILNTLYQNRSNKPTRILFPEGSNDKIQAVAKKMLETTFTNQQGKQIALKSLVEPVLLFADHEAIPKNLATKINCITTVNQKALAEELYNIRKAKGLTLIEAEQLVSNNNYYGMMLLATDAVDCFVGGINYTTANILRPALQIIKANKKTVSSAFIMNKNQETYIFTDGSINIEPSSEQLVEITMNAIDFTVSLNLEQFDQTNFSDLKVAMLSYSTNGSGSGVDVDKVKIASTTLNKMTFTNKNKVHIAGEIQFDAAFDETVRKKKFPDLNFSGSCNIFVFPDLEAANIGYKIAQRLGNFKAIGPIVLGLKKPVNDLSRGATIEDIYETALITISQAQKAKQQGENK